MNLKTNFIYFLVMTTICAVFVSTSATADRADDCIHDWEYVIDHYNRAVDDANQGWSNVTGAPQSAWDDFNSAKARASTYWKNFGGCSEVTSLTERDIDNWDEDRRSLERNAECGMDVAAMEIRTLELERNVDRYNRDEILPRPVDSAAFMLEAAADEVLASWACENNGWSLDLARNRRNWSRDVQSALD